MKERDCKTKTIREFNRSADAYDQRSPFYYCMARLCDEAVLEKIAAFAPPIGAHSGRLLWDGIHRHNGQPRNSGRILTSAWALRAARRHTQPLQQSAWSAARSWKAPSDAN